MRKAQDQKRKTEKEDRLKSVGRAGAPQGAGGRAEAGLYKGVGQSGARPGEEAGVGEKTATSVDGPGGRGQGGAVPAVPPAVAGSRSTRITEETSTSPCLNAQGF